jgi:DNA-binding NarL/FixJ family response regulator
VPQVVEVGHRLVIEMARDSDRGVSTRLLICHDDLLAAEGLARLGEAELGALTTVARPAIADLAEHVQGPSDLVVTDCFVAGQRIDEQVRTLAATGTRARILVVASRDTEGNRTAAAHAGVSGYCARDAGREAIADAFLRAGSGQHAPPLVTPGTAIEQPLTPREREVLLALERGLQVKEVARDLQIAQSTVKGYVRNIFTKLDVHSATAALYVARDSGILGPSPSRPSFRTVPRARERTVVSRACEPYRRRP